MAVGVTLEEIVEATREEARLSSNTSRGTDHRQHVVRVIKRHYRILCEQYDWQHLKIKKEDAGKTLAAAQRYYDFPTALNIDQPFKLWVKWGGTWQELEFGIGPQEYSILDSDIDQRADPAERWSWYENRQFEIWPLPASDSWEVRFEGKKNWTVLVDESSRADLDDTLLSLFSAGTLLAENKQKEAAQEKFDAADALLARLSAARSSQIRVAFGRGVLSEGGRRPRHPTFIRSA